MQDSLVGRTIDGWHDADGRLLLSACEKKGAAIRVLLESDRLEPGNPSPVAADPETLELAQ